MNGLSKISYLYYFKSKALQWKVPWDDLFCDLTLSKVEEQIRNVSHYYSSKWIKSQIGMHDGNICHIHCVQHAVKFVLLHITPPPGGSSEQLAVLLKDTPGVGDGLGWVFYKFVKCLYPLNFQAYLLNMLHHFVHSSLNCVAPVQSSLFASLASLQWNLKQIYPSYNILQISKKVFYDCWVHHFKIRNFTWGGFSQLVRLSHFNINNLIVR